MYITMDGAELSLEKTFCYICIVADLSTSNKVKAAT